MWHVNIDEAALPSVHNTIKRSFGIYDIEILTRDRLWALSVLTQNCLLIFSI